MIAKHTLQARIQRTEMSGEPIAQPVAELLAAVHEHAGLVGIHDVADLVEELLGASS